MVNINPEMTKAIETTTRREVTLTGEDVEAIVHDYLARLMKCREHEVEFDWIGGGIACPPGVRATSSSTQQIDFED